MAIRIERVLAATDFSAAGQRAVGVAAQWARLAHAPLRIVHVMPPESWLSGVWGREASVTQDIERYATEVLRKTAESLDPKGTSEISTSLLSGAAARSIIGAVRAYRASLLVIGARGERDEEGERTLGGTAAKLLAAATTPLLLVRRTREDPVAPVVAALDLTPQSKYVLGWADFAAGQGQLHAYHAYDVPFTARLQAYGLAASAVEAYAEQARSQAREDLAAAVALTERTGATSQVVERGDAAALLKRYIESVRPSLVVLGKHAATDARPSSARVGSVCRLIANSAATDVLAV